MEAVDEGCNCPGELLLRDGLPILDGDGPSEVVGTVIIFEQASTAEAYQRVCDLEPDTQYRWDTVEVAGKSNSKILCNALLGKSPKKGSTSMESRPWLGEKDPLFNEAFAVIDQTTMSINKPKGPDDVEPIFQSQMAYMLLWSAIERYTSLRYHLGREGAWNRVKEMANEDAFAEALQANVLKTRGVQRADDPVKTARLIPGSPVGSLNYYYQVRSNITHRGKTAFDDFDTINSSLNELKTIFRSVLCAAFAKAKFP